MMELDLWSIRKTLEKGAADDPTQPIHARSFAAWIQHELPANAGLLMILAADAAIASGPHQSSNAATLGYAVDLDRKYKEAFQGEVSWLSERQYFMPGRALGFEIDGLALLGVAVGLRAIKMPVESKEVRWLKALLEKSLAQHRPQDWNEALISSAAELWGINITHERVTDDLRVALSGKNVLNANQAVHASAWALISGLAGATDGMTRAAAQGSALAVLVRDSTTLRTGNSSVKDVANILNGIQKSMRRWAWDDKPRTKMSDIAQWVVDNEYHVQDMLWVVLAPIFPDLDDEEWLKSLGHHHPRADLAIPSLSVIIEVKFARQKTKPFTEIIKEVAADASTYLQEGSGYSHMIAFVWDDGAKTEEHSELRQGLLRIRGVRDAIVLPRPQRMKRS